MIISSLHLPKTDSKVKRFAPTRVAAAAAVVGVVAACSPGEGSLSVTVYGESFIEDGIPAEEMSDDWAIHFDSFLVDLEDVRVGTTPVPLESPVELAKSSAGQGHQVGTISLEQGDYADWSFTVSRVSVVGSAARGSTSKHFEWTFEEAVQYGDCETVTTVEADASATFQITMHADHLFYDSLVAAEPKLSFQLLADADTDGDDDITRAELSAADIGAYDPGSEDGVDELWSWLTAQARTLAHVNGEGHCAVKEAAL